MPQRSCILDWSSATGRRIFGAGYFARSTSNLPAEKLAFETLEKKWRDQEKVCLPQYFSWFGLLNAKRFTEDLRAKELKEAKRGNRMAPTRGEAEAIQLLLGIMRDLAPVLTAVFEHGDTTYTVAKTDAVLGELKQGRTYRDQAVFLGADVFLLDFSEALSTFLHEHAHIYGQDGHRGFSDALTELLEVVIRHRHAMDEYEVQWTAVRDKVAQERLGKEESPVDSVADWLAGMNEEGLREVLDQVPQVVLRQVRKNGVKRFHREFSLEIQLFSPPSHRVRQRRENSLFLLPSRSQTKFGNERYEKPCLGGEFGSHHPNRPAWEKMRVADTQWQLDPGKEVFNARNRVSRTASQNKVRERGKASTPYSSDTC